jgi:hypothetical protein
MSPRRRLRCESLEVRHVLDSVVVFNELMYNPAGDDESLEWIELHNQMAIDIDLSKWELTDGVNYTFPEGTIIPGRGYLLIAADLDSFEATTGIIGAQGPFTGQLNNSGESIRLRDRNNRELDRIDFRDEGAWPAGADGSGASLAKINQDSISGQSSNWRASAQIGGSPGFVNFPTTSSPAFDVDVILPGAEWQYDASNTNNGTAWRNPGFVVPGSWSTGATVFGAGTGDIQGSGPERIENVVATASSNLSGFARGVANLTNGSGLISGGAHRIAPDGTMWLNQGTFVSNPPAPSDLAPEVTFDLGSVQTLDHMKVWNYNEYLDGRPELLSRGVANADILIAGEDRVFTVFIANQAFNKAPGNETTPFAQTINFGGTQARYVKFDIHGSHVGGDNNFVGLSEVQFFTPPDPIDTDLPLGATTYYFRKEFGFSGDPSRTSLFLDDLVLDDGAVVYLNGVEVYRQNMPAGAVSHSTLATPAVGLPAVQNQIEISAASLVRGSGNVLAVEVHQSALGGDSDMVFSVGLSATISPPTPEELQTSLVLNEIGQGGTAAFFVEIGNKTASPVNVGGYVLETTAGQEYVLPASTLAPGAVRSYSSTELGFFPAVGDRIFLKTPNRALLADGFEVKGNVRGRTPALTGEWGYPDVATPGAPNSIPLHDEIVINEIMYHHRPTYSVPGTPPVYSEPTTIFPRNTAWKFNRSGANLGANWYQTNHVVNGTTWYNGSGPLGHETNATLLSQLNNGGTNFDEFGTYSMATITYYFQKEFNFAGVPDGSFVQMRHWVDDGAIFYLNGVEIPGTRYLMPEGAVTSSTPALSPGVGDALNPSGYIDIPIGMLNIGTNILSVEVHQFGASSDIFFGMEITAREILTPAIPPTPFSDNEEEWVELYNRSNHAVDISEWHFDDGIDFLFPPNTIMQPGSYLVIARDAASLAAKYPSITIAGSFDGELNNQDDTLRLRDAQGNIADVVHYYDGGRWSGAADGEGSSLELRDPDADNNTAEAWAASEEGSKSEWNTYTYRRVAGTSAVGGDNLWDEFIIGLLDSGEVLLDDITVRQVTGAGSPVQLLQNSTFQNDAIGAVPAAWRWVGNHRDVQVIADPTNAANKVLRLSADGQTEHMSNHGETTLKNGTTIHDIIATAEYEISYRAKWISGSPQLNTRLWFNRAAQTTILEMPTNHGTPGAANSALAANIGPTYEEFIHSPAVPQPMQAVTVSTLARDPNGVNSMTLWYSIAAGAWQSVPMTLAAGRWSAQIPGSNAGTIVQFYVQGADTLGATSTFPADGREARALYKVNDNLAATNGLHNFRLIVTTADGEFMHANANLMSQGRVGATVIYNESEIFYDVGLRLKGSEHSRVNNSRLGFNVSFNSDQLFRGFHGTVALDRSESTGFGQREMLSHQTMNHVGGVNSKYHDLVHIMTPQLMHTGAAELQLARYGDEFLDEQFENGSDGTVFEYEYIYNVSTATPNAEGAKIYQDIDGVASPVAITNLGDDPERYRYTYLIKNNADKDDYTRIVEWAKAMGQTGTAFTSNIGNYIDVDQWLRAFAFSHLSGAGDSYSSAGDGHNVQFYVRPEDNKVIHLPHDLDAFYQPLRPIAANADLNKLLAVPQNAHMYYGHMHDMLSTTYNLTYMTRWAQHFKSLLPGQLFDDHLSFIGQRSTHLLGEINRLAGTKAAAPFNITSPDQNVNTTIATVSGTGWVDVRNIRKAGDSTNLAVTWNAVTGWTATVPADFGTHVVTLEAYDFQDKLIGSDTITITSTVSARPLQDFLRVTEVMYHPADPSAEELALGFNDADQFEYIEFKNVSATETLNLANAKFTNGVEFSFAGSAITSLAPGAYVLVVVNPAAFTARYGAGLPVAGAFTGQLNNAGETIRIEDINTVAIQDFTYDDTGLGWHPTTDGDGYSLVIQNPLGATSTWSDGPAWRPSGAIGGSPGSDDSLPGDFDLNGNVNLVDLSILHRHIGTITGATRAMGDMDGDGDVDRADVAAFARGYGRSSGSSGGSPVVSSAASSAPAALAVVRRAAKDDALRILASRRAPLAREVDAVLVDAVLVDAVLVDAALTDRSAASGVRAERSFASSAVRRSIRR